jgi:hypothetical protein
LVVKTADAAKSPSTFSHQGPLALWLAIQLLVLLIPALQIPLSDQFPRPAERLAADEMAVAQVVAGALLFPLILRSLRETLLLAAASWPFLQLAGFLSSASPWAIAGCACYISMWLLILGLWRSVLCSGKSRLVGAAIATAICLAPPLLWYLRTEFAAEPTAMQMTLWRCVSPVMGAIAILRQDKTTAYIMAAMLALLLASVLPALWLGKRHRG